MSYTDPLFSVSGKTVLITGGYRGIGLSLATAFLARGARVIINGRSAQGVQESGDRLKSEGYDIHGSVFDVTDEEAVRTAVSRIRDECGRIDVLVNNAGIQMRNKLEEMPVEDFRKVVDINLNAAFIVAREVVGEMLERRSGKIINICSIMSDLARPTIGNYSAAKGGLKMLTQSMAAEWAQYNIQANGIAPGYFATELTQVLKADETFNSWICNRTPARRWGDPKELQGAAIFLASDASSFVNGQLLYVDGGLKAVV